MNAAVQIPGRGPVERKASQGPVGGVEGVAVAANGGAPSSGEGPDEGGGGARGDHQGAGQESRGPGEAGAGVSAASPGGHKQLQQGARTSHVIASFP